jgi:hypothetical protein
MGRAGVNSWPRAWVGQKCRQEIRRKAHGKTACWVVLRLQGLCTAQAPSIPPSHPGLGHVQTWLYTRSPGMPEIPPKSSLGLACACQLCMHRVQHQNVICVGIFKCRPALTGVNVVNLHLFSLSLPCRFVLQLPANLPLDATAPLLCAGITTYSPLRHFGLVSAGVQRLARSLA